MTSSTPTIKAVTSGPTSDPKPEHGLSVLRRIEAQGLIRIACDALSETSEIASQIHRGVYSDPGTVPAADLQRLLLDALTCMETADHYLRMLDEVIDPGDESRPADPVPIR
jgi:hypothetical protein